MNDPASALFRHAMDDDIYLQYIENLKEYRVNQHAARSHFEKLVALLDGDAKKEFDIFMDEDTLKSIAETEAAFMSGLAFGLQLLRLS